MTDRHRSLALSRETVRCLAGEALTGAAGGAGINTVLGLCAMSYKGGCPSEVNTGCTCQTSPAMCG